MSEREGTDRHGEEKTKGSKISLKCINDGRGRKKKKKRKRREEKEGGRCQEEGEAAEVIELTRL